MRNGPPYAWSARPPRARHPICPRQSPRENADTCSEKLRAPLPPIGQNPDPRLQIKVDRVNNHPVRPGPRHAQKIALLARLLQRSGQPQRHNLVSPRAPASPPRRISHGIFSSLARTFAVPPGSSAIGTRCPFCSAAKPFTTSFSVPSRRTQSPGAALPSSALGHRRSIAGPARLLQLRFNPAERKNSPRLIQHAPRPRPPFPAFGL